MRLNYCIIPGALAIASIISSCQQTLGTTAPATAASTVDPLAAPVAPAGAPTETAARAAIGRYLQGQPNANLYVIDSSRAVDLGAAWQVLVPRKDWARRMPNRTAFEVDKQTGNVKTLMVK